MYEAPCVTVQVALAAAAHTSDLAPTSNHIYPTIDINDDSEWE